jgi:hypothetical protein
MFLFFLDHLEANAVQNFSMSDATRVYLKHCDKAWA